MSLENKLTLPFISGYFHVSLFSIWSREDRHRRVRTESTDPLRVKLRVYRVYQSQVCKVINVYPLFQDYDDPKFNSKFKFDGLVYLSFLSLTALTNDLKLNSPMLLS
jgi:hypothetical protein